MTNHIVPESLVFGVTLDQTDELLVLVRTVTAIGDVLCSGASRDATPETICTLGEMIFDSGNELRSVLDAIDNQRIGKSATRNDGEPIKEKIA